MIYFFIFFSPFFVLFIQLEKNEMMEPTGQQNRGKAIEKDYPLDILMTLLAFDLDDLLIESLRHTIEANTHAIEEYKMTSADMWSV